MSYSQQSDQSVSLSEVHRTITISPNASVLKRLFAFAGPAYLVSVGYMDPGNWATDLEGGARFGYSLIWVLLMSNLMAVLLQTLSARLGIVSGRDLAQVCRESYPAPVAFMLWVLCEVAIAACDLAEVMGTAIGLNLLFHIPLLYGVILTGFDTMVFLVIQHFGIRKMEAFILSLVVTIGACFAVEVFLSQPVWHEVVGGFAPHLTQESLYVAIGILGATVMPHNLYLHSALVQTRAVEPTTQGKQQACKWNFVDTAIALNAAFFVNSAILIVAAAVFYKNGIVVTEIQQAHQLLSPLLGTTFAGIFFAIALLSAGQSSTLTGTLAGQIVMEGFLQFRIRPFLRRLITRAIAIIPAILVIAYQGESGSYGLLILSQVILSLQLPFAVIPLIKSTSDRQRMGQFTSPPWVQILAWIVATIIVGLNIKLVHSTLEHWMESAGDNAIWLWVTVIPIVTGCALLLLYITVPKSWLRKQKPVPSAAGPLDLSTAQYSRIGVAIDYGKMDEKVLSHAQTLALQHHAILYLFHVVEGVSGQLYGKDANDDEARSDLAQLENIAQQLRAHGLDVSPMLGYGRVPDQIIKLSNETKIDFLVMGGHRHRGLKDIFVGASISHVRHKLAIPVLVVQ